jgi:hypothetical protein
MSEPTRPPRYGGNKIPASYLARFLPSQGQTQQNDLPHDLRLFMEELKK